MEALSSRKRGLGRRILFAAAKAQRLLVNVVPMLLTGTEARSLWGGGSPTGYRRAVREFPAGGRGAEAQRTATKITVRSYHLLAKEITSCCSAVDPRALQHRLSSTTFPVRPFLPQHGR